MPSLRITHKWPAVPEYQDDNYWQTKLLDNATQQKIWENSSQLFVKDKIATL